MTNLPLFRTLTIIAIIGLYYLSDVNLMNRFNPQRQSERRSARSWSYTIFAAVFAALFILQPVLLPQWTWTTNLLVPLAGLVVALAGLALNRWARIHLGRFFLEGEEIQEGHTLVDTGPYRYVRHPLYTSFFLLATGLLFINPSVLMLAACIYAYVDFSMASRRDERLLNDSLPEYAGYTERTPRFFPRISNFRK